MKVLISKALSSTSSAEKYKFKTEEDGKVSILRLNQASGQWLHSYGPYDSMPEAKLRLQAIKKGGLNAADWKKLNDKVAAINAKLKEDA